MTQSGVIRRIRMKRVVRAGRVVAVVGVVWVERKSVRVRKGDSRMLKREVRRVRSSRISSRDLWLADVEEERLWEGVCFWPVMVVEESGE
jgi:hypothetical protein